LSLTSARTEKKFPLSASTSLSKLKVCVARVHNVNLWGIQFELRQPEEGNSSLQAVEHGGHGDPDLSPDTPSRPQPPEAFHPPNKSCE